MPKSVSVFLPTWLIDLLRRKPGAAAPDGRTRRVSLGYALLAEAGGTPSSIFEIRWQGSRRADVLKRSNSARTAVLAAAELTFRSF
jgi:hypothetical protein